ncbi:MULTISPECIES: inositol monophosphatase family protein [unclassified Fibrobacter]|uniref:inositol monophosphatase family protein n=1 Tax=unclassified Fibrobacter TaxID=2634177 RepID=UPI000D6D0D0A|nr:MULTISPECIES: inositol monophosphatase family protein [unclassified Fibrobacter]PWJ68505.1 myo-inositol-1(or 4)-monophosphatase [Fibrobacter sp. UWR4]PZW72103.1 myo-inositol-1(or 4)-monophosphatase [Fibrobacter sp. UWR1]
MNEETKEFLRVAEELARKAGAICLDLQNNLGDVKYKTAKDVVTIADVSSEKLIVEGLRAAFPTHSIRTEEAGVIDGSDSRYRWIIDPVDGTVNFSRGIPLWGISIALHFEGKPLVAVVNLPKLGEMFTAIKGQGAFMNGKPIHVSREDNPTHAIVSNGDFNVGDAQKINAQNSRNFAAEAVAFERVKCFGSAVIEGCFTACGRLDCFVMTMSYPWDIAAIALLVEEAGGKSTHIDGSEMQFVDAEQVAFSNGILHDVLVKTVN